MGEKFKFCCNILKNILCDSFFFIILIYKIENRFAKDTEQTLRFFLVIYFKKILFGSVCDDYE